MKHFTLLLMASLWSFFLFGQCSVQGIYINSYLIDPNSASNNFDTDGDSTATDRDEFVQICNQSAAAVNLGGFTLSDIIGTKYTFSSSDSLISGDCITIITHWNNTSAMPGYFREVGSTAIWNNGGDSIKLSDGTSSCVVSYGSYGSTAEQDGCVTVNINDSAYVNCTLTPSDLGNIPLPINLVYFSGELVSNTVELKWETASEINNDYFGIEKSLDGLNFYEIGQVTGNGNSHVNRNYSYTDYQTTSITSWYRIKQVDFDGKQWFSNVIRIKAEDKNIQIYDKGKELVIEDSGSENTSYRLLNSSGIELENQHFYQSTRVKKNDYAPGLYYLLVYTNGKMTTYKVQIF